MDQLYPLNLNLILAVAAASATIFLGFLPTKTIPSSFFAREAAKALIAWVVVALTSPYAIVHYPLILAFLCFASWWHFRRDRALPGKMWLSVASGLGISVGVMLILAVTPRAYPPGLTIVNETLLLASIYLGGAVIGLSYVCFTLVQSVKTNTGATQNLVQRYVGILPFLALARAAVILGTFFVLPGHSASKTTYPNSNETVTIPLTQLSIESHVAFVTDGTFSILDVIALGLAIFILPTLGFLAQSQAGFSSRTQPTRPLVALIFFGILTEILARLLVL